MRDLDVLLEHVSPEAESLGDDREHGRKLLRTFERSGRSARLRLIAALDNERYFARARYAAELSGAGAYVKAAKVLQHVLGEHQDAVVAAERLRDLATRMPDTALAAGRLVERERMRALRGRDEWRSAWKKLAKAA